MPQPKAFQDFLSAYPSLQAIGNTPMVKLDLPLDFGSTEILAKYEQLNPGGSIKDRPVLRMLVEAMMSGQLTRDKVVLDSTSGNAGIAYAMIGATLGCKVQLVMPANASEERKKRIRAHGADIVLTDPLLGYDESLREGPPPASTVTPAPTSSATSTRTTTTGGPTMKAPPKR